MSYIFMRSDERIKSHQDAIDKIIITKQELEKIQKQKLLLRTDKYIEYFSKPYDIDYYQIEFFKRQLYIGSISHEINEINSIIKILDDGINKENEYINNIKEEQKLINDIPDTI